jgi:hypothetical protein
MERAPPAYMGRPRRKPPSPGRQWFVARRFPTLAASSFQPPLHGFPSSSGCVCHVAQADGDPLPRPTLLLCRLHQGLALLDNKDNHHLDRIAARRALVVDRALIPHEGRIAIVTDAGWDAVDAAALAREVVRRAVIRERARRARRTALKRTAKPCGPDTRGWCQAVGGEFDPTGSIRHQAGSDGGKTNSSPGRARHKPSTHCAGNAGVLRLYLYARVRNSLHHCTRDRGCSKHPAFPAPSQEGQGSCKPRAPCAARR